MPTPYFRDVSLFIMIARQKLKLSSTPPLESVPMLALLGESDQAATTIASRQCIAAIYTVVWPSNNGMKSKKEGSGHGPTTKQM
jgi:hypothetical protein